MNPSQRLAFNTAATYGRSLVSAGLAVFSSRWVLSALGEVDYGLFSLVGSILVFITFLNTIMSASASRHFAYAIGQDDLDEVNLWFNAALSIHLCLAFTLTLIGWLAGEYVIAHQLNIPIDRLSPCLWVFRISLISLFIGIFSVPFVAMFQAKQRLAELSVWDLLYSVLAFTLAWYLVYAPGDRLIFYAIGMTALPVFVQFARIFRAISTFGECTIDRHQWFDKSRSRDILAFSMWSLIGNLGGTLRNDGSAILLNVYFGPTLNAAYNIAKTVSSQTDNLAGAMLGAFSPEITASEGRGDRGQMINLSLQACKFGAIFAMIFSIPLMVEMDYVLNLWLVAPPLYSASFCRLILATFLIDRLSSGYVLAVSAHGKIAAYQATVGTALVLTLPLAWLFLKLGYAPTSVGIAFIVTMTICSIGRVLWTRHLFGVPVHQWIRRVVFPCGTVAFATALAAIAPSCVWPASFLRLVLASTASAIATVMVTWFVALSPREREFIRQNVQVLSTKMKRLCGWHATAEKLGS